MSSHETSEDSLRGKVFRLKRGWGVGFVLTLLAGLWLALVATEWAKADDVEYNFNWLDPDKKVYVLQNRKYLKAGHPVLTAMAGTGFSNPYRLSYNFDARLAYYFTEAWGLEVLYTNTMNFENSTFQALTSASPVLPSVREIRGQAGAMVHYVPWYAKINVFNSILYFDWYFGAGAGLIQSFVDTRTNPKNASVFVDQNLWGIFFSTGHQYHLSQHFLIRIDFTGVVYPAPVNGTSGDTSVYSNLNFAIGAGWRI